MTTEPSTPPPPVAAGEAPVLFAPASTDMMQVVDFADNFNEHLEPFLAGRNFTGLGFDYHVTAILGAQSSGKSTLLNLLFGTRFCTMDEDSGRYQVTQGVWLGLDNDARTLVLDLEGTDSRERGDSAVNFERKIALFALALSEVLIVNLWAQDVGRYNAANMDLLKTVMELDLQLFFGSSQSTDSSSATPPSPASSRMHKTKLLFVLRDHASSPFDKLCTLLTDDVNKIWDTISKPDAAQGIPVTDLFDLDFYSLPHKVFMQQQFEEKGAELRRRFVDGEVFCDQYRSGVAADGFPEYARNVWETIRANRELDIPTQKEMLAHVRCEQLARDATVTLEEKIGAMRNHLMDGEDEVKSSLVGVVSKIVECGAGVVAQYEEAAGRYSSRVAADRGRDLRERVLAIGREIVEAQIFAAEGEVLDKLRGAVGGRAESNAKEVWHGWGILKETTMTEVLDEFDNATEKVVVDALEDGDVMCGLRTTVKSGRKKVAGEVSKEVELVEDAVTEAGRKHAICTFKRGLKGPLEAVVDAAGDDMWTRVAEISKSGWEQTRSAARDVFGEGGVGLPDGEVEKVVDVEIRKECLDEAVELVKDSVGSGSAVLTRMMRKFDEGFRYDERGLPRHFGPREDIDKVYIEAREAAEGVVARLASMRVKGLLGLDEGIDLELLGREAAQGLREELRRTSGATYSEAKRLQEAAKVTATVPMWILGLMLVLGWNEILAVFRSPLLFMLLVLLVPAVYVGYMMDAPTLLAPAVGLTVNRLMDKFKDVVKEWVADRPAPAGAVGVGVGAGAGGGAMNGTREFSPGMLEKHTSWNGSASESTEVSDSLASMQRSSSMPLNGPTPADFVDSGKSQ